MTFNKYPVENMADALYTALAHEGILPDITCVRQHKSGNIETMARPTVNDVEVIQFLQTWPSTALGFGGIGGMAITRAYTTVIICNKSAAVFFNGKYAYTVDATTAAFNYDLKTHNMEPVSHMGKYRKA